MPINIRASDPTRRTLRQRRKCAKAPSFHFSRQRKENNDESHPTNCILAIRRACANGLPNRTTPPIEETAADDTVSEIAALKANLSQLNSIGAMLHETLLGMYGLHP